MQVRAVVLAAVLALAPLGARAADLVVWWEKGFYPEEDRAAEELIGAYEQKTGRKVQLDLVPQWELRERIEAAVAASSPPDLALGGHCCLRTERWAAAGLLADLSDVVLPIKGRFFPWLLDHVLLPSPQTGKSVPYSVPLGQYGLYIHVWRSLLERAGLTLADIPKEWKAFWSFWCDRVQPAVRKALGRDDLWGMGLAMSTTAPDTFEGVGQFMIANSAYLSNATLTLLDDPTFRRNLVTSLAEYTALRRKDCVPPDAVTWRNPDNNKAFLEQRVVMTINSSLSIPAALRVSRAEDYFENTVTIGWPEGPDGRIYPLLVFTHEAVVFRQGRNVDGAKDFLRFLLEEGRLGVWLEAAQGRHMPTMVELLGTPFWVDPADPHRLPAVEQLAVPSIPVWGPMRMWLPQWDRVELSPVLARAVHRVVTEGISPEQAMEETIARIKQILSE